MTATIAGIAWEHFVNHVARMAAGHHRLMAGEPDVSSRFAGDEFWAFFPAWHPCRVVRAAKATATRFQRRASTSRHTGGSCQKRAAVSGFVTFRNKLKGGPHDDKVPDCFAGVSRRFG